MHGDPGGRHLTGDGEGAVHRPQLKMLELTVAQQLALGNDLFVALVGIETVESPFQSAAADLAQAELQAHPFEQFPTVGCQRQVQGELSRDSYNFV